MRGQVDLDGNERKAAETVTRCDSGFASMPKLQVRRRLLKSIAHPILAIFLATWPIRNSRRRCIVIAVRIGLGLRSTLCRTDMEAAESVD